MKLDLAFTLVDCADEETIAWYQAAAAIMLESANHAFKGHDIRYVQMTDEASKLCPGVGLRFNPSAKCEREELAMYRGHCSAEWALYTDRPTILVDVDFLWNNAGILQLFDLTDAPDITLFRREQNQFQPFNGGLILTKPGQRRFWETYKAMMKTLPMDVRPWWGDQIGLSVMVGTPDIGQNGAVRFGSKVAYIPIDLVAPSPKSEPTELLQTSAVHFKGGKRKPYLVSYYNMLKDKWDGIESQRAAE